MLAEAIDNSQLSSSIQGAGVVVQESAAGLEQPVAHADNCHAHRQGLQVQLERALLTALSSCWQRTVTAQQTEGMRLCSSQGS